MNSNSQDSFLNIINLFGDMDEAFYQLGLTDKQKAKTASEHIRQLVSTPWDGVNMLANKTIENFFDRILYKDPLFEELLHAYSQGSGLTHKEFLHSLLVPEICAFLSKWLPKISPLQFGCSSLYCLDNQGRPIHARILDFPLKGTYDENERIIRSCFKDEIKVFNFSTVGLPFSGLTSVNEEGLSLAIHQKFSDTFNQHGTPIFFLAHQLIHSCVNIQEALEFLESSQSITCWCFNLMDSKGNVLEADLAGSKLTYNISNLHDDGPIYTCNELVDRGIDQKNLYPQSIYHYNESRKLNAKRVLAKVSGKSHATILKEFASPIVNKELSPITLSSMACVSFSPLEEEVFYINGEAPKLHLGTMIRVSDIWNKPKQEIKKTKVKKSNISIKEGHKFMAMAQTNFDTNKLHECYHYLQMAIEEYEDDFNKNLANFYFLTLQYINETHEMTLKQIQSELLDCYKQLPKYLQDICLVLDQRIAILTDGSRSLKEELNFEIFSSRIEKEARFNKVTHMGLKKLTFIHMDIMDVIFA